MDVILMICCWWTNQINPTYSMVNKFEHGMVIFLDISLKRTTIDVCRKHTNTGQCVLISSHEYWPRKMAWGRALLCQASHIQLFQDRLSYKSVKAYATKSKGTIGNVDQLWLDWSWRHFIITERNNTNTCLCFSFEKRC